MSFVHTAVAAPLSRALASVFDRRYRGFRVVELVTGGLLCALVLATYAFKADAGREDGKLNEVDRAIAQEQRQAKLLRAELARLEQPARLERLSQAYLGLAPAAAKREAPADSLADLARQTSAPSAAPPAQPAGLAR